MQWTWPWKKTVPLFLLSLTLGLAASCGGEQPRTAARTLDIQLGEFLFQPQEVRLKAGETVTLDVRNSGALEHEFMLGRGAGHDGVGHAEDFLKDLRLEARMTDGTFGEGDHGRMMLVRPGGMGQLTMEVPPDRKGEWEMACFLPGHYEGGMKGRLIVE
jgi:uncharacterized cupredoxin-like copper-binding protein